MNTEWTPTPLKQSPSVISTTGNIQVNKISEQRHLFIVWEWSERRSCRSAAVPLFLFISQNNASVQRQSSLLKNKIPCPTVKQTWELICSGRSFPICYIHTLRLRVEPPCLSQQLCIQTVWSERGKGNMICINPGSPEQLRKRPYLIMFKWHRRNTNPAHEHRTKTCLNSYFAWLLSHENDTSLSICICIVCGCVGVCLAWVQVISCGCAYSLRLVCCPQRFVMVWCLTRSVSSCTQTAAATSGHTHKHTHTSWMVMFIYALCCWVWWWC